MNAGLGKSIREKWPEVFANYQKKQWQLGDVQLVQVSEAPLYVANVAGQHGYGTDKRYTDFDALATGLKRVNAWATQQNLPVYIPSGLGSGLAGGCTQAEKDETWRRVQTIIETQCPSAIICSQEPLKKKNNVLGVKSQIQGEVAMTSSKWIKNWFSNTAPLEKPIVRDGISYTTVENYYAASKTLDIEQRRKIALMEPHVAKTYAQKVQLRPDWEQVKVAIMYEALIEKFAPPGKWHRELAATIGQEIIEFNNWSDQTWGVPALRGDNGEAIPTGQRGDNLLGRLLMFIRDNDQAPSVAGMLTVKQKWLLQNLPPALMSPSTRDKSSTPALFPHFAPSSQ